MASGVGTYFTVPGVQRVSGLMTQMSASVRTGLNGSADLNPITDIGGGVSTYIGLQGAPKSINMGELTSVGFTNVPSYERAASINVAQSAFQATTDLEATMSFGVQQMDPRFLGIVAGTATAYNVNTNEYVLTSGLSCVTNIVPVEIAALNEACEAPASPVLATVGISAIVFTGFRCQSTSGLSWDEITRANFNNIDTEWAVLPLDGLASDRNLWSAYIF